MNESFHILEESLNDQYRVTFGSIFNWYRNDILNKVPLNVLSCYCDKELLNNIPLIIPRNILHKCIGVNGNQLTRRTTQWKLYCKFNFCFNVNFYEIIINLFYYKLIIINLFSN